MRNKILAAIGIQKIEEYDNISMKQHWDIVMFFNELSVIEELGYKVELEALESVEVRLPSFFRSISITIISIIIHVNYTIFLEWRLQRNLSVKFLHPRIC